MNFSLDKAFGVPKQALEVQSQRSRVLAENIANADTPNFKARDIDFRAAMRQAGDAGGPGMQATHARHLTPEGAGVGKPAAQYRVPANPSLDGNTVEMQAEQARFAETTVHYRASLNFLGSRIQGLIGAIKGE